MSNFEVMTLGTILHKLHAMVQLQLAYKVLILILSFHGAATLSR